MGNPQKSKGDRGEREVERLLRELIYEDASDLRIRRALGAGRQDDVGDIFGVRATAIQVAWWTDVVAAIRTKLRDVEEQRRNARYPFGVAFVRLSRASVDGTPWVVCMTPRTFVRFWRYACLGLRASKRANLDRADSR